MTLKQTIESIKNEANVVLCTFIREYTILVNSKNKDGFSQLLSQIPQEDKDRLTAEYFEGEIKSDAEVNVDEVKIYVVQCYIEEQVLKGLVK